MLATTCHGVSLRNCSRNGRNRKHRGRRDENSINVIKLTLLSDKGKYSILCAERAVAAFMMSPSVGFVIANNILFLQQVLRWLNKNVSHFAYVSF